jgi:hypothetical protein
VVQLQAVQLLADRLQEVQLLVVQLQAVQPLVVQLQAVQPLVVQLPINRNAKKFINKPLFTGVVYLLYSLS